jgi:very-short-patch-repair endonuclease
MTMEEKLLWSCLRGRRLGGFKFRRQHPVDNFIADFYCEACSLVIEVDGEYHNEGEQREYDSGRTYELSKLNVKAIRSTNREIRENPQLVLDEILAQLAGSKR